MSAFPTTGRLIQLGAAYCQETCLMSEKSRMPRLYILSKIGISLLVFALNSSSPTFGLTSIWHDSTHRWDLFLVNFESWNQMLVKGKVFFLGPRWKGKWLVVVILNSKKTSPDGRGADNLRCRNNYHATNVSKHLRRGATYSVTSRRTMESNTAAHSVTSLSAEVTNWRPTHSFTLRRNQNIYLATYVRRHLRRGATFSFTSRLTLGSNTLVHSVTSLLVRMVIWRPTPSFTLGRNITVAHSATSHSMRKALWRSTPSFTPGRNRTSAHSATIHATSLQP